jgi:two-component system cell cycle sensor histidine kinase/response regulator CckA
MTAHSDPPPRRHGRFDPLQIVFWASVAMGVAAAGVAISAGPAVGRPGAILLILLAAAGLVLFLWMARGNGRRLGAFPERGAMEAASLHAARNE